MDDVVKVLGWIIFGAVAVHLLSSTQFPGAVSSITGGLSNIIGAINGQTAGTTTTAQTPLQPKG